MGCLTIILATILLKTLWVIWMCHGNSSFETERSDILKRRRYLINQTMVEPQKLLGNNSFCKILKSGLFYLLFRKIALSLL